MEIKVADVVLCEFYFTDLKKSKKRPVLVLKDNLPFGDFVGIPLSSQIEQLHKHEHLIDNADFCDGGISHQSKLIVRKTFVISKSVVIKKYHGLFCEYFCCC
jgi:mRNA interferase MazF